MNQTAAGTHGRAAIVFHDASVKRGDNIIWSQGSFSIPIGSVTAIVGTNGAGKTTMMRTELGLQPLYRGTVQVLGRPAGKTNEDIGYVPQSYTSEIDSNLTAEQSVLLGLTGNRFGFHPVSRQQRDRVRRALEYMELNDRAHYRLSQLSGGLRQRVAIAQALVSGPKLLMLDEPLANLDLSNQHETVHLLARLNKELDMTIQVVAHDMNMLLPILDGAVYLLDGHPHYAAINEVLDPKLLTHLYGTAVQVITTPQGNIFVTPSKDRSDATTTQTRKPAEITEFQQLNVQKNSDMGKSAHDSNRLLPNHDDEQESVGSDQSNSHQSRQES